MNPLEPETYGDKNPHLKALALGLLVVEADDFHVQVDLDTEYDKEHFFRKLNVHCPYPHLLTASAGGNQHAYVKLPSPRPIEDRITLALALGSDKAREGLALVRVKKGQWPLCLFETAEEYLKVQQFLGRSLGNPQQVSPVRPSDSPPSPAPGPVPGPDDTQVLDPPDETWRHGYCD